MKRILVVDDDETVRESVMMLLEGRQYDLIEADNGAAAFALAKTLRPDLIITDIVMDNGNGFLLKELIRGEASTASIPLVLMTGHAKQAGAWRSDPDVEYLDKPFSAAELFSAIQRAMDRP